MIETGSTLVLIGIMLFHDDFIQSVKIVVSELFHNLIWILIWIFLTIPTLAIFRSNPEMSINFPDGIYINEFLGIFSWLLAIISIGIYYKIEKSHSFTRSIILRISTDITVFTVVFANLLDHSDTSGRHALFVAASLMPLWHVLLMVTDRFRR